MKQTQRYRLGSWLMLPLLLLFLPLSGWGQDSIPAELIQRLQRQLAQEESQYNARIGVSIRRLGDSLPLLDYRADELFVPASIVKLTSTAAALSLRHPDYRFATQLYICGRVVGSRLEGDLLIRGGGDPSLGSRLIPEDSLRFTRECIEFLQRQGIKTITGDVFIDASLPSGLGTPASWMIEDVDNSYGAGIYGLNYRDNYTDKWVKQTIKTKVTTKRKGKRRKARHTRHRIRVVWHKQRPSDADPAGTAKTELASQLELHGIKLEGEIETSYEPVEVDNLGAPSYTYYSLPLDTLVKITNHRSVNLFAEGIGQTLATDSVYRADSISRYWYRTLPLKAHSLNLYDASGLSRKNSLTPRSLGTLLQHMMQTEEGVRASFLRSLPRAGEEGTVRRFLDGEDIEAYLKSGSMQGVMAYAGYIRYRGAYYSVVMIANDFPSGAVARGAFTRLLRPLFPSEVES